MGVRVRGEEAVYTTIFGLFYSHVFLRKTKDMSGDDF